MRGAGWRLISTGLGLLLAACAAAPRQEAARIAMDPGQCVANIHAVPVALKIPFQADRGDSTRKMRGYADLASCVIADNGEPSPLLLMEVGQQRPVEVQLSLLMREQIALAAQVDLLDRQRRVLRTIPFADFSRRGGAYTGSVFLNEGDAAVAYMLVRPDAQAVGDSDASVTGQTTTTAAAVVAGGVLYAAAFTTGSEVLVRTWLSEVGSFTVRAVPVEVVLKE